MPEPAAPPAPPSRHEYKRTWTALSETFHGAKIHVIGDVPEERVVESAAETRGMLAEVVGLYANDVVLEIGCGIGRVGQAIAPMVTEWIGCDVSPHMLAHARERLTGLSNVRLVELSGFDLAGIAAESVDLVYCTVVFMHLDEWDRFSYVEDAYRVLRPGGRFYCDNFSLCTDEGWELFLEHRRAFPRDRPAHVSKGSTPQELDAYLYRAGFVDRQVAQDGVWLKCWGKKPGA